MRGIGRRRDKVGTNKVSKGTEDKCALGQTRMGQAKPRGAGEVAAYIADKE